MYCFRGQGNAKLILEAHFILNDKITKTWKLERIHFSCSTNSLRQNTSSSKNTQSDNFSTLLFFLQLLHQSWVLAFKSGPFPDVFLGKIPPALQGSAWEPPPQLFQPSLFYFKCCHTHGLPLTLYNSLYSHDGLLFVLRAFIHIFIFYLFIKSKFSKK